MGTITIRRIDDKVKTRLRIRAAHHGRSMEEEAREILREAVESDRPSAGNLADAIHKRFAPLGGVRLALPSREAMRRPPKFGK